MSNIRKRISAVSITTAFLICMVSLTNAQANYEETVGQHQEEHLQYELMGNQSPMAHNESSYHNYIYDPMHDFVYNDTPINTGSKYFDQFSQEESFQNYQEESCWSFNDVKRLSYEPGDLTTDRLLFRYYLYSDSIAQHNYDPLMAGDADYFLRKAEILRKDGIEAISIEEPADWGLEKINMLTENRSSLEKLLEQTMFIAPELSADAIFYFDCWLIDFRHFLLGRHIDAYSSLCKEKFFDTVSELKKINNKSDSDKKAHITMKSSQYTPSDSLEKLCVPVSWLKDYYRDEYREGKYYYRAENLEVKPVLLVKETVPTEHDLGIEDHHVAEYEPEEDHALDQGDEMMMTDEYFVEGSPTGPINYEEFKHYVLTYSLSPYEMGEDYPEKTSEELIFNAPDVSVFFRNNEDTVSKAAEKVFLSDWENLLSFIYESYPYANLTSINIIGYTDTIGTAKYNKNLAHRRALYVKKLIARVPVSKFPKTEGITVNLFPVGENTMIPDNTESYVSRKANVIIMGDNLRDDIGYE